jgi:hypothetical protein
MYQIYVSDEDVCFSRHCGNFTGAEGFKAILSFLEANPSVAQIKAVCFDLREVTSVTLGGTDRSNASFFKRKYMEFGQQIESTSVVRLYNPENVAINEILYERESRIRSPFEYLKLKIDRVYSVPDALKALGLPADYFIEYPAKK